MSIAARRTTRRRTFARGVHPDEQKQLAAGCPIEALPTPPEVRIALLQHLGAPCQATVEPRSEVAVGDVVGRAEAFVSAPVHASVAGTVARAAMATLPNGRHVAVVPIRAAEQQPLAGEPLIEDVFGGDWPLERLDRYEPLQIVEAARAAGLVGQGGAAFPTHVKLSPNQQKPIATVLVNGCECEPYLAADYRLMLEAPAPVLAGALLAGRAAGAAEVIIGIEDNKPEALETLRTAARRTPVVVQPLKTKYPQGGEKQLIAAVLNKVVPGGGLPLDIGVVVINIGTAAALARAVLRGKPLTHRVLTVSGGGIRRPRNLLVPIGASYRELIEACGGLKEDAARVVAGGPMMGFTVGGLDVPVTKGTSGVTVLSREEIAKAAETPCVRCGRCVEVCPMGLVPTKLALATRVRNAALAQRYHVAACIECGCCAYACPAKLPLVQLIRLGKIMTS
ncbi:MAG: electron transport complex subunit RsxC [Pirellulales bacterium]|nr:electron transport complex subunit RsxC [Pirellulales bacterium]